MRLHETQTTGWDADVTPSANSNFSSNLIFIKVFIIEVLLHLITVIIFS